MPKTRTPDSGLVKGLGLHGDEMLSEIETKPDGLQVRISNVLFSDVRDVSLLTLLFCMGLNSLQERDRLKRLRISCNGVFVELETACQELFLKVIESYGTKPQDLRGKINDVANAEGWIYLGFTQSDEVVQSKFDSPIVSEVKVCSPISGKIVVVPVHALLLELGMLTLKEKAECDEILFTLDWEPSDFDSVQIQLLAPALEHIFDLNSYWGDWFGPIMDVAYCDEMLAIDYSDKPIEVATS